jgi:hypothetical protein
VRSGYSGFTRDFGADPMHVALEGWSFGDTVPEPVNSTLFLVGGATFLLRLRRNKKIG